MVSKGNHPQMALIQVSGVDFVGKIYRTRFFFNQILPVIIALKSVNCPIIQFLELRFPIE